MTNNANRTDPPIDPAILADVVRQVIARLQPEVNDHSDLRLISLETLAQHQGPTLVVGQTAVITPAARDEAVRRGIAIERCSAAAADAKPGRVRRSVPNDPRANHGIANSQANQTAQIIDRANPNRGTAVGQQLSRRGIQLGLATVILSETPASDLYEQIASGKRAAMITQISDAERFADELNPTVWVLDMKRLNIPAAVNTVAVIAKQGAR